MTRFQAGRDGVALVIALAFIVMVTVLVVGLNGVMMVERPAANSHLEKVRASQYAQQGVELVVARLDQNLSDPTLSWISQPGQLTVNPPQAAGGSPNVKLYSGDPTTSLPSASPSPAYLQAPELNISTLQDPGTHLITERKDPGTGRTVSMPVKWVYVRQGGEVDPSEAPALDRANPVVGRYAYWTDDESCKINNNLAWGRGSANTAPVGDPTRVDLTALQDPGDPGTNMTATMADAIHAFITGDNYRTLNNGFFNTPKEARRVQVNGQAGGATPTLEKYKFEVTHYNHDPDTTFFNEPRIILTTRPDRAGWTYKNGQWVGKNGLSGSAGLPHYIRILANEKITGGLLPQNPAPATSTNSNLNPGPLTSMDPTAVSDTVNLLLTYLQRTDWPMVTSGTGARSFQEKYFSVKQNYNLAEGKLRLAQLAANIIDYVRSKESPDAIVPPLRLFSKEYSDGSLVYYNNFPSYPYAAYMGSSRMPFINEVGCYYNPVNKKMTAVVEIYCPPNYGIASYPVTSLALFIANTPSNQSVTDPYEQIGTTGQGYTDTWSALNLTPGGYVWVSRAWDNSKYPVPTSLPLTWRVGLSIFDKSGNRQRVDLIPLVTAGSTAEYNGYSLHVPFDKTVTSQTAVTSLQCDDPRTNTHTGTWSTQPGGGNTFGTANHSQIVTLGTVPTPVVGIAQQDINSGGQITDASFYMPSPAGTTTGSSPNPLGCVTTVGELGYIHTGIEGSNVAYANLKDVTSAQLALPKGIPWRTLRLQPNNYPDASTVPDWALMDLFAAPSVCYANAKAAVAPHDTAVGGRVNLNSVVVPFDTTQNAANPPLTRKLPLTAVLQGCNSLANDPSKLSFSEAQTIVDNIYNVPPTLAPTTNGSRGKAYGTTSNLSDTLSAFVSPGEVTEIKGVADKGEASEELVRQISNLVTVRSGVFSVYTVGQAIKQTPTGALLVTGEQRAQAMVERYVLDETANPIVVKFRSVYYRNLTR